MSLKLRDLIRNVRACRSQADERALIAKECAEIRTSFKSKDDEVYRHRNVAKLLYIHMLGYPTHFGQMEAMKLLATQRFAEKRIGYLALIMLFDEHQSLLMLATNSMKNDLHSNNPYICGLALTAIGNIASQAIARDLSLDVIEVMTNTNNNHYLRKKAALTAIRIIHRVPEIVEDFIQPAYDLMNDKHNNVQMCALQLIAEIIRLAPHAAIPRYRGLISRLYAILRSTWSLSYNEEYDIMGINDPFLQVQILRALRSFAQTSFTCKNIPLFDAMDPDQDGNYSIKDYPGVLSISTNNNSHNGEEKIISLEKLDSTLATKIDELLALVIANIDSAKVPGASIHYEAILTTLTVSNDQNLRVNTIIQLGKFLQAKDNNIRYISLNTMYHVAQQQLMVVANTNNIGKSLQQQGKMGNNKDKHDTMFQLKDLKQTHANALTNLEVIQRYRNIIVAYLKDSDPSIRKMALSLVYALVTEKNVRPLVRELLMYLSIPTSSSSASGMNNNKKDDKLQYRSATSILEQLETPTPTTTTNDNNTNNNNNNTNNKSIDNNTAWTNIPGLVSIHLPYSGGSSEKNNTTNAGGVSSSLFSSSTNYEFKCDLTQKIYYIIYQYSPNIIWQIYSMICLLSTDNEYMSENFFYDTITLLQNYSKNPTYQEQIKGDKLSFIIPESNNKIQLTKQHIDSFIIHELFFNIVNYNHIQSRVKYAYLVQVFLFLLPTNIQYLITPQGFSYAQLVSAFLQQDSILNAPKIKSQQQQQQQGNGTTPNKQQQQQQQPVTPPLYEPTINYNNKQYMTTPVTSQEITTLLTFILSHKYSTEQTKQMGLTSVLRVILSLQKDKNSSQHQQSIKTLHSLLEIYRADINIDLQQRANEYLLLTNNSIVNTQAATKVALPIVMYNRQNLDFVDDDMDVAPTTVGKAQEIDVFASLNNTTPETNDNITNNTPEQTTTNNNNNNGLNILNDLLAPAPAPVQQPQPTATTTNPFDLLSQATTQQTAPKQQQDFMGGDIFSQMSNTTPTHQQQPLQPQQQTSDPLGFDLFGSTNNIPANNNNNNNHTAPIPQSPPSPDLLDFTNMTSSTGAVQPQKSNDIMSITQSNNNSNNGSGFDALAGLDFVDQTPVQHEVVAPVSITNTSSSPSNNFDMLGGMDFGTTPPAKTEVAHVEISPQQDNNLLADMDFGLTPTHATTTTTTTNNNNNNNNADIDFEDEFESAVDDFVPQQEESIIQKTITVYNQDDVEIVMNYTAEKNKPAMNNITYKILLTISTQGMSSLDKFDFKVAMKAPLTKELKTPSSRQLGFGNDITQELIVVNTSTNQIDMTTFRCLYSAVDIDQGGKQVGSKPFSVSM